MSFLWIYSVRSYAVSEKENEWETFFDHHAAVYMENVFTKNTEAEVDFILGELALPKGAHILDVGCGAGRHAVELAKRGFEVTGVDISTGMLTKAKEAAATAGVDITLVHSDAADYKPDQRYDAVLCLCEGAFGLLGSGDDPFEHELSILRNINSALKDGARTLLTVSNGMRRIRTATKEEIHEGIFDPLTLTEKYSMVYDTPNGERQILVRERGFTPPELVQLCKQSSFVVEHIWGGTAGAWNREDIDPDEMEIMVIAKKEVREPSPDAPVTLEQITKETLRPILRLDVTDYQKRFVAPNPVSIAEAHFADHAWFRAICAGGVPVGFVMLYLHEEGADFSVWRFMIDKNYQRMGFGGKAMEKVLAHVRSIPSAKELMVSYVPGAGDPSAFYEKFGFVDTGEWDDGERVMKLAL
jgi:SAM-dependent methyltransferase/RimJ/RimL family protein N-acetyltransferase